MIFKNKRQVVIINDIKSDSIEQAIFILRDKTNKKDNLGTNSEIVLEAERIINSFLSCKVGRDESAAEHESALNPTAKSRKDIIIGGLLWLASAAVVVGISTLILSFI